MKNVAVLLANALDATIFMQDQYGNGDVVSEASRMRGDICHVMSMPT